MCTLQGTLTISQLHDRFRSGKGRSCITASLAWSHQGQDRVFSTSSPGTRTEGKHNYNRVYLGDTCGPCDTISKGALHTPFDCREDHFPLDLMPYASATPRLLGLGNRLDFIWRTAAGMINTTPTSTTTMATTTVMGRQLVWSYVSMPRHVQG